MTSMELPYKLLVLNMFKSVWQKKNMFKSMGFRRQKKKSMGFQLKSVGSKYTIVFLLINILLFFLFRKIYYWLSSRFTCKIPKTAY